MSPGLARHPQRHCEPLRDSRLDRLPPTSNSCASPVITGMILFRKPDSTFRDHAETSMIAPTARRCKRPRGNRSEIPARRIVLGPVDAKKGRDGIVSGNHNTAQLPPSDRPAGLRQEKPALARSFRFRIPQPPAPRGRQDRACSQELSPYWANESWSFFFLRLLVSRGMTRVEFSAATCRPRLTSHPVCR